MTKCDLCLSLCQQYKAIKIMIAIRVEDAITANSIEITLVMPRKIIPVARKIIITCGYV